MPAPIVPSQQARPINGTSDSKTQARGQPQSKRTRTIRRRGRARDEIDTDDEIEREVATDSESDEESSSESSSSIDSDTEPASEDVVPNGHPPIVARKSSLSPEEPEQIVPKVLTRSEPLVNGEPMSSFFAAGNNWSEMVADETLNGPAELPVIDFKDFNDASAGPSQPEPPQERKSRKSRTPPRTSSSPPPGPEEEIAQPEPSTSSAAPAKSRHPPESQGPRHLSGFQARQAYQKRLETDPSYVPVVGEFWGHDDRLLDKDLRSLSGWWRGRWQGRGGRGRGAFDRGFSARGRGGPFGAQRPLPSDNPELEAQSAPVDRAVPERDPSPADRPWTHDGFEEMKRRDERRRMQQQQQQQQQQEQQRQRQQGQDQEQQQQDSTPPMRGSFGNFRGGRGSFVGGGRDRGGFVRGGFQSLPTLRGRPHPSFSPSIDRVWFAMKPERMWTKQYDGFLHFDPSLKPRPGQGPGYRIRVPGKKEDIVRAPPQSFQPSQSSFPARPPSVASDGGERTMVVRIPKASGKKAAKESTEVPSVQVEPEPLTTVDDLPIEDVFTVRPELQVRTTIPEPQVTDAIIRDTAVIHDEYHPQPQPSAQQDSSIVELPPAEGPSQPFQPSSSQQVDDSTSWPQEDVSNAQYPVPADESGARPIPPVLPPLQTSFSPIQHTPPYGSPYGYPTALPPGIAVSQHGMPYELATGRPVYLQPPPIYNPQPVMPSHMVPHAVPFMPGHLRHHSTVGTPELLSAPHTPSINGFMDPSTGAPMFVPPRQGSRIEIRPPTDDSGPSKKSERRPSGLRTSATAFEPSLPSSAPIEDGGYFTDTLNTSYGVPAEDGLPENAQQDRTMDPAVMGYPHYQQQYYYSESYGYPGYVEMSQMPHYEMYTQDPHASQGTIYY